MGDTRPSTRVTVDKNFELHTTGATVGTWTKGPARWFQDYDTTRYVETEIPNITSVNTDRSVDADAGTCDIVITNDLMPGTIDFENPAGQFGNPGAFTWDHGDTPDSRARWGHSVNQWNNVLVPNALLRTYQGFGGQHLTVQDAVDQGYLVLNGVWLVDDITISTEGTLSLKCRDMAKLLIDQQIFPPLVPASLYPLDYFRWDTKPIVIPPDPAPTKSSMCFPCEYHTSSTDEYYGEFDTGATGHRPSDAFDISGEAGPDTPGAFEHQRTYWLSEPKGDPNESTWIEFVVNGGAPGDINQIYHHAWAGNAFVMVSVFEGGEWAPAETSLGGVTPEGVPFVSTYTVGWEGDQRPGQTNLYDLPRDYRAERIRLTITGLAAHGADGDPVATYEPGWRAGIRKAMACYSKEIGGLALVFAGAAMPYNTEDRFGYWQVKENGLVYAFGDARVYPANSPDGGHRSTVVAMAAHPSGTGYWTLDTSGRVLSYGTAQFHGDIDPPLSSDYVDLAPTSTGDGYWVLLKNGTVLNFGDAADHGHSPFPGGIMPSGGAVVARSITAHPTISGYWVLWTDGTVTAHNVTHWGNADRTGFNLAEYVGSIHTTHTGNGYWIAAGGGIIQAKGDAPHKGNGIRYGLQNWNLGLVWDLIPSPFGDGYAVQHADGNLEYKGDFKVFGSVRGGATMRLDGNYRDYSDIVRDLLLWAGFYLRKEPQPGNERPEIYGNIDSTGAYAQERLPKEMFDKKPIIDPIKEIKAIVGYVFYIDAEGGAVFDSPNWWTMGNFLTDVSGDQRTPYPHMPEIDETVQLTSHSIVRSAQDSRSEIIIATQDPYPTVTGQPVPAGVVVTRSKKDWALKDLKGLTVVGMWTNGKFLNPNEQRVMADLIDMRMWFARRTATIACVANPLIDINDQVRVIERQTGEVYVHYIKGISISHDLESGEFTMNLTTYWLGGSPYGVSTLYLAADNRPQNDGYWQTTISGQITAYGSAQLYDSHQADSHLGWIVALHATPTGLGYYTLDVTGRVLTYGDAVHQGELVHPNDDVIDMALTASGLGYWVLQIDGTVTPFGDAVHQGQPTISGNMQTGSPILAQCIESHPTLPGYWILLSDGNVHAYGVPHYGNANRDGFDFAEYVGCLRRTNDGGGYWILSGGGIVQAKGNAPWRGDGTRYNRDNWVNGLCWELLTTTDDGYAVQHADGSLDTFHFETFGTNAAVGMRTVAWALVSPEIHETLPDPTIAYPVSAAITGFLAKTGSPSANNAVASRFDAPVEPTIKAFTP